MADLHNQGLLHWGWAEFNF